MTSKAKLVKFSNQDFNKSFEIVILCVSTQLKDILNAFLFFKSFWYIFLYIFFEIKKVKLSTFLNLKSLIALELFDFQVK